MKKILSLLLIFIIITGCSQKGEKYVPKGTKKNIHKPYAWGHRQTIYIFADNIVWKYAKSHLETSLERLQFTTENETYFKIKRAEIADIDQFYKFNNLIFFCDLSSNSPVSIHVKSIMQESVKKEVKENNVGIFPIDNLWANDQFVVFMIADNEENLLKLNILQSNKLFDLFKDKFEKRIAQKIYEQNIYNNSSFAAYPWNMKIPKKYVVYKQNENFISFICRLPKKPDRYIAVYYEDMPENNVNKEWLLEKRKKIAWDFYDEDFFKEDDIRQEKYKFLHWKAFKLSGRWQNLKYGVGGAFQSFAFYDEKNRKAYLIDNSVYFPEGYKLPSLLELEAISKTFEIK